MDIHYYELECIGGFCICLKGVRMPTIAEANAFTKVDREIIGNNLSVVKVSEISFAEAQRFYNIALKDNAVIFGGEQAPIEQNPFELLPITLESLTALLDEETEITDFVHSEGETPLASAKKLAELWNQKNRELDKEIVECVHCHSFTFWGGRPGDPMMWICEDCGEVFCSNCKAVSTSNKGRILCRKCSFDHWI